MPKAVVLTQYEPRDILAWSDVSMPGPVPGQARTRIKAAGVGPTALKIRHWVSLSGCALRAHRSQSLQKAAQPALSGPEVSATGHSWSGTCGLRWV